MGGAEASTNVEPQVDIQENKLKINGEKLLDKNDFIIDENDAQKLEEFLQSQIENREEVTDEVKKNIDKKVKGGDLLKYTGSILEGTFNYFLNEEITTSANGGISLETALNTQNTADIQTFVSMLQRIQEYDTENQFDTHTATINLEGNEYTVEIGLDSLINHLTTIMENKENRKNEAKESLRTDSNNMKKILNYIDENSKNTSFVERITERSEDKTDGIQINTGNLSGKFLGTKEEFVNAINENNTKRNGEQIILQEEETETEQVNTETEQVNTETEQVNTETEQINEDIEQNEVSNEENINPQPIDIQNGNIDNIDKTIEQRETETAEVIRTGINADIDGLIGLMNNIDPKLGKAKPFQDKLKGLRIETTISTEKVLEHYSKVIDAISSIIAQLLGDEGATQIDSVVNMKLWSQIMQKQIDYLQKRSKEKIVELRKQSNKTDTYKTIQAEWNIIQNSGGMQGTLMDKKHDYNGIIPDESDLLKEGIEEGKISSKGFFDYKNHMNFIENIVDDNGSIKQEYQSMMQKLIEAETNTPNLDYTKISITTMGNASDHEYHGLLPNSTKIIQVPTKDDTAIETIIFGSQVSINMDIINELVRQDDDQSTEKLAKHLKTIEKDMSNRGTTSPEQLKNIQQTLEMHLENQDRAKTYLAHIDKGENARKDNLNIVTEPNHKSILESYTKIYDTLKEELQPKKPTLQDQVKNVTEQVEKQANEFREKRGDVIVQAADFFFGGKDGLLATLDERGIKIPRLTDKIKEQYQKEFAFSSDQQETFTKILEGLPQDGVDNPFTKPFGTSKEAINKFFETNTQNEYLKVAKEQYTDFSPKAVQQLISLYNKGNPNNKVEPKDFVELNNKNEPTGIKIDSRNQFKDILSSKTTQNLITQADEQINGYKKVGENYVYNMNPENFGSATDKNINTAKDVAQYMTAFLVAGDKDFKYVITENNSIDTGEQKEAQENPEEEFTKNLAELTKNIDDESINNADGYEYSNDNATDYQAKILQPMSELFAEDNYDLLVEEIKKYASPIKERLQKPENFKNLFLFENTLTNITKGQDSTRNTLVGLTNTSISIDNDNNIIADSGNTAIGKFKLNPTDETNKKIITKIEDTNA